MRTFVKALMGTAVLGAISTGFVGGSDAAIVNNNRTFSTGKYELQLDKANAGFVKAVAGGSAVAEVVSEKLGPDNVVRKHVGQVKYQELTLSGGVGMSRAFYQWIADTLDHKPIPNLKKNGAVIAMDADYNGVSQLEFRNGFLTEIGFPALDASSKDAALFTLGIAPETTTRTKLTGAKVDHHEVVQKQKVWTPANFRFKLDNLDVATSRVSKIEAITIKQKLVQNQVGEQRDYESVPATLEIPNIVFSVAESHADDFYKWHEDFVIKGNNGQDKERGGSLVFLAPDNKTEYFTLSFANVGIVSVVPDKVEAGADHIRRVKVTCYVEQMKFSFNQAVGF